MRQTPTASAILVLLVGLVVAVPRSFVTRGCHLSHWGLCDESHRRVRAVSRVGRGGSRRHGDVPVRRLGANRQRGRLTPADGSLHTAYIELK
jgi:hypothetical protein